MKKKLISILLAVVMLFSIALITACNNDPAPPSGGGTSTPSGGGGTTPPAGGGEDPGSEGDFAEHVTLSIATVDAHVIGRDWETNEEWWPVVQYIMDRFNVSFDFYALDWGDMHDVQRMWLASGTAPDVMFWDIAPVRYGEFYINATQDNFFRPYNLNNMPNAKHALETGPSARNAFMIDGNLYAWAGDIDSLVHITPRRVQGVMYRYDWAQEVGLANENDLYSYDEWINLVQTVVDAKGVSGVSSVNWSMPRDWPEGLAVKGITNYVQLPSGEYTWGPFRPESLEVVQRVNQLFHDGLVWPDQVLASNDEGKWAFIGNELFAWYNNNIMYQGMLGALREYLEHNAMDQWDDSLITEWAQNHIRFGMIEIPSGGFVSEEIAGVWSQSIMSNTISDLHAERWEAILDWGVSEVGYFTRAFGIQGTDWDFDTSGNFVLMWDTDEDGNVINPNDPYCWWPFTRFFSNMDGKDMIWAPDSLNQTLLRQANALIEVVEGPRTTYYPQNIALDYFTGSNFIEIGTREPEIYEQIAALLRANPADVEAQWNSWVDGRRAMIQPVVDELNAALR